MNAVKSRITTSTKQFHRVADIRTNHGKYKTFANWFIDIPVAKLSQMKQIINNTVTYEINCN